MDTIFKSVKVLNIIGDKYIFFFFDSILLFNI